jgi:hypothetical protein
MELFVNTEDQQQISSRNSSPRNRPLSPSINFQDDDDDDDDDDDEMQDSLSSLEISNSNGEQNNNSDQSCSHKALFLTRRLSGSMVMRPSFINQSNNSTSFQKQKILDEDVLILLNELLLKFPDPPHTLPDNDTQNSNINHISQTALKAVSMGWGSIKGFASNWGAKKK